MAMIVGLAMAAAAIIAVVDGSDVLGIFAANGMTMLAFGAAAVACLIVAMLPRVGKRREVEVDRDRRFEREGHVEPGGRTRRHARGLLIIGGMEAATAATFSLELTQDQRDIRDWVHGFAEQVVRPAAAEWDEREETPWPIIEEAAKIGLYGFEALAQFYADETGLTAADRQRGAVLGRRGDRHVDHGHVARRGGDLRPGHRRADRRVGPAVLRHRGRAGGRRLLRRPSPTPAPTSPRCARARCTTRRRTSGC